MASRPPRARAKWLFVVACFGLRGAAAAKPNLLIFQPDDLAFLWVEAPPASTVPPKQRFNTPALDLLREEGVVFTRAYASAPMCAPSRFGVVTSRYPSRSTFAQAQTSKGAKNGDCGVTYVSVPPFGITYKCPTSPSKAHIGEVESHTARGIPNAP
jgi:hypothetical protein